MSNENYMAVDLGSQAFKYVVFDESGNQVDSGKISSGSAYKDGQFNSDYMRVNFQSLKYRIQDYNGVSLASDRLKIVATAGFRNAKNSDEILKIAKQDFGLNIEVIDGEKEAYYSMFGAINDFNSKESDKKHINNFIHIDIGGRSTEVSFLLDGKFKTISLDFGISVYNQRIINAINSGDYINRNRNIDLEKDKILNEISQSLKEFKINPNVEDAVLLMNNQSYKHICSNFEKDDNTTNLFTLSKVMPELSRIAKLDKKKILAENYLNIEAIDEKAERRQSRKYSNFLAGSFLGYSFFKSLGFPENLQTFSTYSGVARGLAIDMVIEDSKKTTEEKSSMKEDVVINEKFFIGNDIFEDEFPINNSSHKQTIKEFYEKIASRDEAKYEEKENQSINTYSASITYKTGEKLDILSKNPNHIALASFNKEGKPQIPELKHFTDIVKYAETQKMDIVFADIKDNEYSARLYLACLQNGEVKVDNPPKLDEAFWKTVDEKTKQEIQKLLKKDEENVVENNKPVVAQEPKPEPIIRAEQARAKIKDRDEKKNLQIIPEPIAEEKPTIKPIITNTGDRLKNIKWKPKGAQQTTIPSPAREQTSTIKPQSENVSKEGDLNPEQIQALKDRFNSK